MVHFVNGINTFCRFSAYFSATLRAPPSPTGEGWQKSLLSSARVLDSRPPCTFSGRADNACTNLLGFFVRYVRTRGIVEVAESGKIADFIFCRAARARHAWLARLTRARGVSFQREGNALFDDFWYFSSQKSTIKKSFLMILLFQSSFRLSEKNEKDKKRNALTPVSATPFRGGFATLNPPLGHTKVR